MSEDVMGLKEGPKAQNVLVSFKSGHYKQFRGVWIGDSVWGHHKTTDGRTIHINKDEVEYIQTSPM